MKVDATLLRSALRTVRPALGRDLPLASCVLLDTADGQLYVTAGIYDFQISAAIGADGDLEPVAFPLRRLQRLLAGVEGMVELSVDKNLLTFNDGELLCTEPTQAPKGFARAAFACGGFESAAFQPIRDEVASAIRWASASASNDSSRPILTSVYVAPGFVAATDSYRLSVDMTGETGVDVIVPRSIARDLPSSGVSFARDETRGTFRAQGVAWTWRIPHGEFPNVPGLITSRPTSFMAFDRGPALRILKRLSDLRRNGEPAVFVGSGDGFDVTMNDYDTKTAVRLPGSFEGDIAVGFNPALLLEAIKGMPDERITLHGLDDRNPWQLTSGTRTNLVMPIRWR